MENNNPSQRLGREALWKEPVWIPNHFAKPLDQIEFQINQIEIPMTSNNSHSLNLQSQSQTI